MKIGYLTAILKRYIYFIFFPKILLWLVYIYGVKVITKFRWESGFLKGVPWNPPYAITEVQGTLCSKSVKVISPSVLIIRGRYNNPLRKICLRKSLRRTRVNAKFQPITKWLSNDNRSVKREWDKIRSIYVHDFLPIWKMSFPNKMITYCTLGCCLNKYDIVCINYNLFIGKILLELMTKVAQFTFGEGCLQPVVRVRLATIINQNQLEKVKTHFQNFV